MIDRRMPIIAQPNAFNPINLYLSVSFSSVFMSSTVEAVLIVFIGSLYIAISLVCAENGSNYWDCARSYFGIGSQAASG